MTFEPLIHVSPLEATLICLMWSGLIALSVTGLVTVIMLIAKKRKNLKAVSILTIVFSFVFGLILVSGTMEGTQVMKNEATVLHNLSQKYQVEEITFAPRQSKKANSYPEQSEPQKVTVKTNGESRRATLTQNRETSEPTLIDIDSGLPMEDILKSQQ